MQGEGTLTPARFKALVLAFPLGVLLAHLMRAFYIRLGWLELSIRSLIPRVVLLSLLFGALFYLLHGLALASTGRPEDLPWRLSPFNIFQSVINWGLLFFFWSAIYLAYHFFQERRRKELEALEWEAKKSEIELKQLKDQLDPHFMFNCLNSIRALVDEDPGKAKKAIGKLSKTLRNSLKFSRKDVVPLKEELELVEDHLSLERIRLEERLNTAIDIPDHSLEHPVPPLMIQSLMENGIKHGVSKIPEGGTLALKVELDEGRCRIVVSNPLPRDAEGPEGTGTGLENARRRLSLLYGERASLVQEMKEDWLRTIIELPLEDDPSNAHHRR